MKLNKLILLTFTVGSFLFLSKVCTSQPASVTKQDVAKASAIKTNSKIETTVTKSKTGTKIVFKTIPNKGLVANHQGHWLLKISQSPSCKLNKTTFSKDDYQEKLAGFAIDCSEVAQDGKIDYTMAAFVCTKDKSRCYRDVHKGSVSL